MRAIAAAAYRRGATFVDVAWFDPAVKLARAEHADEDTLDWVPPWYGQRITQIGEMAGARSRSPDPPRPASSTTSTPPAPARTACRRCARRSP